MKECPEPLVSVIIPARNEFPNIVHTVQSILNDLSSFLKPSEFEIIICANATDDWYKGEKSKRAVHGTVEYLSAMGGFSRRVIRYLYDPIAGNHSTRNKGARMARGKYLFFSDAHMAYKPGYHQRMIRAIDATGGIVHGAISWLGAYPVDRATGYAYTVKLGDEIRGTWNNYKLADDYWYIPMQGHCCFGVKRDQFLDFGGYPEYHRCYGGGEFYLDSKWWMFGSTVAVDPQAVGYHLRSTRGYSYIYDDYIHNVLAIGVALGMDWWAERAYINWNRKGNPQVMDRLWEEAHKETVADKEFIANRIVRTFNDMIIEKPWDIMNDELHGKHNGSMLIFHETWLNMLKGTRAEELYRASKEMPKLEKFINDNLSQHVYKRGKVEADPLNLEATRTDINVQL